MYIAKKDFTAYTIGDVKAGDPVEFNKTWLEFGLIEEKPAIESVLETKPQPKPKRKAKK